MKRGLLSFVALLLLNAHAVAAELRPFVRGDMARLLAERDGRPFVMTLWSVDCPHCKGTLRQLSVLARKGVDVVVVNTDNIGERNTIAAMLAATGMGRLDTWVFGDEAPERLRFEIDRRWGGEMPRTYLFDADHKTTAVSGTLSAQLLKQWQTRNPVGGQQSPGR